jgi:ABC-type bacteriocin/lantibiotic exporter with double-glycine peptidase domain
VRINRVMFRKRQGNRRTVSVRWLGLTLGMLLCFSFSGRATNAGMTWRDVENQIRFHQQRVRMCGPLSAARLLTLRGHDVPANSWLERFSVEQPEGVRVRDVVGLLHPFEPAVRAVHVAPESIARIPKPCILLVNDRSHCVTLESWDESTQTATIWDPSDLRRKTISQESLRRIWRVSPF